MGGGSGITAGQIAQSKWSTSTDNTSIYPAGATAVGIGTSSPFTTLAVAGNVMLDSNSITFASSSATALTVNYTVSATSTIIASKWNAWSLATSTTALPILSLDTVGPYATSTFAGNFVLDGGRFSHDASTGETSIVNLTTGPMAFEDGAGWVSWATINGTSSATADNDVMAYTAGLGGNDVLTIYGQADGPNNGAIDTLRTVIGTTTNTFMSSANIPYNSFIVSNAALCVANNPGGGNCTEFAMKRGQIVSYAGAVFMASTTGIVGIGTTSPYAALSVVGPSGIVADKIFATSTMATSTFMGGLLVGTTTNTANTGMWRLTVQGGICITSGNACPATESIGGLTVDTVDSTPDADDIGELFDLAERYFGSEEMAAGEIAALDTEATEMLSVKRATGGDILVGIVSTAPAISINGPNLTLAPNREATSTRPNIALAGRVPVKVNLEGGDIERGDRISASSEPGLGKKALPSEQTIGFALQEWPNPDDTEDDTVLVYVNLSPMHRAIADTIENSTKDTGGAKSSWIDRTIAYFKEIVTDVLTVGSREKPAGITLYDEDTGEPYCLKIKNGEQVSIPGECGQGARANAPAVTPEADAPVDTAPVETVPVEIIEVIETPVPEQPPEIIPEPTTTEPPPVVVPL